MVFRRSSNLTPKYSTSRMFATNDNCVRPFLGLEKKTIHRSFSFTIRSLFPISITVNSNCSRWNFNCISFMFELVFWSKNKLGKFFHIICLFNQFGVSLCEFLNHAGRRCEFHLTHLCQEPSRINKSPLSS